MPILKYIPKKKNVIDRRSNDGGFYEAECDECGGKFYPKRNNAKYCSQSCQQMAWRRITKDKKVKPKAVKAAKEIKAPKKVEGTRLNSFGKLITYLKSLGYMKHGTVTEIKYSIKAMSVNESYNIGKHIINKVSGHTFVVVPQ